MTRHRLSTTILLLCFLTTAYGQLKKGDWMLNFSGSTSNSFSGPGVKFGHTHTSGRFNVSAGKFLTDRFLAGGGLGVSQSGRSLSIYSGTTNLYRYELKPFARYYFFKKNQFASFVYANLDVGYNFYPGVSNDTLLLDWFKDWNKWDYLLRGGVGLDFFIAPNVALEGVLGLNWMGRKQALRGFDINSTAIRLGVMTFFNQRFENKISIKDQYLRKGNWYIGGSGGVRRVRQSVLQYHSPTLGGTIFGNYPGTAFWMQPNVSVFISDRMVIGGGTGFYGTWVNSKNYRNTGYGLFLKTEYYIPLTNRLFFVPKLELSGGRSVFQSQYLLHTIHWDSLITTTPEGPVYHETTSLFSDRTVTHGFSAGTMLQIKYFTGWNAIFEGGYQFDARLESRNYRHLTDGIFAGFEYFFAPNLSFTGRLNFQIYRSASGQFPIPNLWSEGSRQTEFYFGMNYFIFN